jgi:hypothetical protein
LLAQAMVAWWLLVQGSASDAPDEESLGMQGSDYGTAQTLLHLLVLLMQQLQGAPAQLRASFLQGPAGNAMLRMLSALSFQAGKEWQAVRVFVGFWAMRTTNHLEYLIGHKYWLRPTQLVEMLLPGLLLQPVCPTPAAMEDIPTSSGTSSGTSRGGCDQASSPTAGQSGSGNSRSSGAGGGRCSKGSSRNSSCRLDNRAISYTAPCEPLPHSLAVPSTHGESVVLACGTGVCRRVSPSLLPHAVLGTSAAPCTQGLSVVCVFGPGTVQLRPAEGCGPCTRNMHRCAQP